jgi:hypothetical protein
VSDDVITQLTAKSPRRLLEDLAKLAKTTRPEVELVLGSGGVVRGVVVGLGDDGGGQVALIHTGGQPRAPTVAYVRVDGIVAITVVDASVLVRAAPTASSAPSKLELARALGARAESLTTALGRALPITAVPDIDDEGRRAIAALLPPLVDTLRAIARDPAHRKALDALAGLELGTGPRLDISRQGDRVVIITTRGETPTAERLRADLETVL